MTYELLWNAAPEWKIRLLVLLLAAQMLLTVWLYGQMSKARMRAGKAGKITVDNYKVVGDEPQEVGIYTRAVANQFEMPVMFYAVIIAALALGTSSWLTVLLSAAFVTLRIFHAREMIGANTVMKRRKLFIVSAQVFIAMLAEFVISALLFS